MSNSLPVYPFIIVWAEENARKGKRPLADILERSRDVTSQIIFVDISLSWQFKGQYALETKLQRVIFIWNIAKHDQSFKPACSMHSTSMLDYQIQLMTTVILNWLHCEKWNVRSKVRRNKWKAYSDKTFWSSGLFWWNSTSSIRLWIYLLKKNTRKICYSFDFY